jgi:hypothetical protein
MREFRRGKLTHGVFVTFEARASFSSEVVPILADALLPEESPVYVSNGRQPPTLPMDGRLCAVRPQ